MSAHKQFVTSSVFLFFDQLVPAAANWLFWLIIPAFTTPSEVGNATIVYSVVSLIALLTQLGLEYPLLQKSQTYRSKILCTGIIIELPIVLASIPIMVIFLNNFQEETFQRFFWLAIGILALSPISFVSRYALLGISEAKNMLIIDSTSTGARFLVGYLFVAVFGYGATGILLSYLVYTLLTATITLALAKSKLGFGVSCMKLIKEITKQGLVNSPSKFSKTMIFSLSVILLASYGITNSEIGIFYIALMISLAGGSFVSSMAYMFIPASSTSGKDLFIESVRIGISLTAPIISAFLAAPSFILSIIGTDYIAGEMTLLLLSLAILPFSVVVNAISYFNYQNHTRKLLLVGFVEICSFIIFFLYFVPIYRVEGAALSIFSAFIVSSILSVVWLGWRSIKYVARAGIAIGIGWVFGYSLGVMVGRSDIIDLFIPFMSSMTASFLLVVAFKNISFAEITKLVKTMTKGKTSDIV
jgi:O-antigen/teichoic acid export membrane protein